jgi:hypothetical protein
MLCPVDGQTYTIRMEIDGVVVQWCSHCRTVHTPPSDEVTGSQSEPRDRSDRHNRSK